MKKDKLYYIDGSVLDYRDDMKTLHRLDGPAVEWVNGGKEWYQNGKLHRLDGPAIEHANGDKFWYQNGKLHRVDGPAREWADGGKSWWQNNELHRVDGPAMERPDGDKMWYINDIELTEEEFELHPQRIDYLAMKIMEEHLKSS